MCVSVCRRECVFHKGVHLCAFVRMHVRMYVSMYVCMYACGMAHSWAFIDSIHQKLCPPTIPRSVTSTCTWGQDNASLTKTTSKPNIIEGSS